MNMHFTFTVLRYIHDPVSGEFANVGVLLYAPEIRFLDAKCTPTYGRISAYFADFNPEHFKRMMKHIERRTWELSQTLDKLPFDGQPKTAQDCAARVLPQDDSSLQFSPVVGSGLTVDARLELSQLYDRYVDRYSRKQEKPSRSDDDVMRTFRDPLAQRQVLSRLTRKRITGNDDEYEFPYAWKNGRWNACEPVSLDLVESGSIIDKANRWLGRAHNLQASEENFKLFLLLGKPSASGPLMEAFHRAERILRKMPIDHELVLEDDAPRFARRVEADLREHDEQRAPEK
jgi:hypothetical protein